MDVTDEIVATLARAVQQHGATLTDMELSALAAPRNRWNAEQIGAFRARLAPNWLTLRRWLREAAPAEDTRSWMEALDRSDTDSGTEAAPEAAVLELAREALYNAPRWPDGTPRKHHAAHNAASIAAFFACAGLIFYSIILQRPLLALGAVAAYAALAAGLYAWARACQRADAAEYARGTLA